MLINIGRIIVSQGNWTFFTGHGIAELQVTGVKANFTKRPYDNSTSLMIHSLLVVDAMQTFGQDFELLVASHKNLW